MELLPAVPFCLILGMFYVVKAVPETQIASMRVGGGGSLVTR